MPDSKYLDKKNLIDILDSLEVGVVYVDQDHKFAFVNKAGEDIRGICSEDRLGTSILQCHCYVKKQQKYLDAKLYFQKSIKLLFFIKLMSSYSKIIISYCYKQSSSIINYEVLQN